MLLHPDDENDNTLTKRLSVGQMSEKSNPYMSDKKSNIKEKLRITLKGSESKLSS